MHALMAKKQTDVNSTTQQQFKAIMSGEKKDKLWWLSAVMMCRYSAVSRELLASITRESCLPVSGSTVKVGGRWRRALWSIYEQDIHHENIAIFLVSFFCWMCSSSHWLTITLHLQNLIQGQEMDVEKADSFHHCGGKNWSMLQTLSIPEDGW